MKKLLCDAVGLVLLGGLLGVITNFCRSDALPLIADHPYEILVPCPMDRVTVSEMPVAEIPQDAVFIDANAPELYERCHVPGALSVPYDDLLDPSEAAIASLRAIKTSALVVYGHLEGDFDIGKQQATDLAAQGLPRVYYIAGGLERLADRGCEGTDSKGVTP